jgi:hypothetical protein
MKRNLEEEGFYVERNPNVYWFNLRRMEERLKRTVPPGRFGRWFGPDNKMLSSVDKTISAPQRPIYAVREAAENPQSVESPDERLETEPWKPRAFPYINEEDHAFFEREGNTPNNYRLVFSLHELEFADHPLMIEETRVSKRLKALADTYNSRTKNNITAYWEAKLNALQLAYRDFKIKYPDAETYQQARMQKLRQTAAMAHSRPSSNASSFSVKTIDRRRSNRKDSDSSGDEIDEDRELIYLEKRREYLKQIQKLHDRYVSLVLRTQSPLKCHY